MPNLSWFFGVFIVLFAAWIFTGGPGDPQKPFIEPPPPLGQGGTYGPGETSVSSPTNESVKVDSNQKNAPGQALLLGGQISLEALYSGNSNNPRGEYLEIAASPNNTEPINISGWKLQSAVTGKGTSLGKGAYLVYSGQVNTEQPIFLNPGEHAYVVTGRSPLGVSFKLNRCTGYFEQFQDFAPSLPLQCPHALEGALPSGIYTLNEACIEYLKLFPRCITNQRSMPLQFAGTSCEDYVPKGTTYAGCVDMYKNQPNFYKPEWRIFLQRDAELWKNERETIYLLSESGKLIDSVSY